VAQAFVGLGIGLGDVVTRYVTKRPGTHLPRMVETQERRTAPFGYIGAAG
jgi:hypothetical protein